MHWTEGRGSEDIPQQDAAPCGRNIFDIDVPRCGAGAGSLGNTRSGARPTDHPDAHPGSRRADTQAHQETIAYIYRRHRSIPSNNSGAIYTDTHPDLDASAAQSGRNGNTGSTLGDANIISQGDGDRAAEPDRDTHGGATDRHAGLDTLSNGHPPGNGER